MMQKFFRLIIKSVKKYFPKSGKSNVKLDPYWIQKIPITRITERMEVLADLCFGKKVIHFGCTDYPIFQPETNLHLKLSKICSILHGFDLDVEGIEKLRTYYDSTYYTSFDQEITEYYDLCIVPETIEHVDNIQFFLSKVELLNCARYIITAPNCFNNFFRHYYNEKDQLFIEAIHPDHNCWFSPYTLKNTIEKYTKLQVEKMYLSNNDLMVIALCRKEGN